MKSSSLEHQDLDVADKFSRELDRIPGFRSRNAQPAPIDWIQQNSTRRLAALALGGMALITMAGIALKREKPKRSFRNALRRAA